MAIPRKNRGEYRPIYEAMFTGRDFRALPPNAKLCLLTLKGLCGAIGIRPWPALEHALADLTGLTVPQAKAALKVLTAASWIEHEDGVVWVVRGLEFEPQLTANNANHQKSVQEQCEGLPNAPIVSRFFARYEEFFAGTYVAKAEPAKRPTKPGGIRDGMGDGIGDAMGDGIPHGMGDGIPNPTLTPPQPLPNPTLTPTTTPVDAADAQHRKRLVIAANKGVTALLGHEDTTPMRWDTKTTRDAAEKFATHGVELAFAEWTLFQLASTRLPSDGAPARSLNYFADAVVRAWRAEEAHRLASAAEAPAAIATTPKSASTARSTPATPPISEAEQLRAFAVQYAQAGNPEWIAHCEAHGIDWSPA
ncbi:MAG: hypothetical protein K2Y26_00120 [Gemmatimonadaceae bacterium]|nr:hypothetical protein [Gemmatimonadaceae bacterium]